MDIRDILTQLTALPGPPGLEAPVVERAGSLLKPFVDNVAIDRMGNLLGMRASGCPHARLLMLDAHLDEVGFMVVGHQEGFLRFRSLGSVDPRVLPGRVLRLCCQPPRFGVIACLPPHVQEKADSDNAIPLDKLFLDVGMAPDEARATFPIGTRAVFDGAAFALGLGQEPGQGQGQGQGPGQVSGHALDDRACFAVLLRTMELLQGQPLGVDLAVLGSVQEEVGARGAKTAAWAVSPDACIVADVTHGCTPDAPRHKTFALGGGPCVGVGPGCHRKLSSGLLEAAKIHGIPHQIEVMEGDTGTNSWPVQVTNYGIATAVLSLPLKYMHTPVETVRVDDMENMALLLARYIQSLEGEV
ncbi:MAG: M42 family peptidase [Oscillospiraceae bacterium]|nr:M42 family peptidase [Oscillospiraceae bacterium]